MKMDKLNLLCEFNVIEQVANVCHTTIVQKAWQAKQELLYTAGYIILTDGILKDLGVCITGVEEMNQMQKEK